MRNDFAESIKLNQNDFDIDLNDEKVSRLTDFYELVMMWNAKLHLVAPCSPSEFAVRHVLESLFMTRFLPENAKFADIGAGAGLPSLPCLITREDLRGVIVESNAKKCVFLRETVTKFGLQNRVEILNQRFEVTKDANFDFVACRAIEKFAEKLPEIIKFADKRLLFGGESIRAKLSEINIKFDAFLLPQSEQRFLFVA
ncbi:MAG: class I SAM-dependent methyltransferase [Pyrinomonadaceae bacterium]|nr:class I SAM-dependent methyltransferase [Pyrinomonadaceae bacterium]